MYIIYPKPVFILIAPLAFCVLQIRGISSPLLSRVHIARHDVDGSLLRSGLFSLSLAGLSSVRRQWRGPQPSGDLVYQ